MSESATSIRELRKQQTERRIRMCAMLLTRDRGLDGWTMDDLAGAAEVSRRTLFNYVPSKIDAIIGDQPQLPDAVAETFTGRGPTGNLLDDLGVLSKAVLADTDHVRETVELRRAMFMANPGLFPIVHERFEKVCADLVDLILLREGADFGQRPAALVVKVLVAIFDACITSMLRDDDPRPLEAQFDDALHDLRHLFR